jgi:hypothetical protein
MATPRTLVALALALTSLAPALPALAQPKPSAAELAEAKTHFEKGLKLYKEKALPEAVAEFTQANKLVPRASVLRNIAQCHRDMRQFALAYADYAELLEKYRVTLKAAEIKSIEEALADLGVLTGLVKIDASEPGATVEVDGREVGATPLDKPVRANVGPHDVAVKKAGFGAFTARVELAGKDEVTVAAKLAKDAGHLVVTAVGGATGARLLVDGADVGALPWEGDLPAGPHRLDVAGADLHAPTRSIELARGARSEVVLELSREVGHLLVDPRVADAEIKVDGAVVAKGAWEGELKAGRHELEIAAPGFVTLRRVVLVNKGERRVEGVVLEAIAQAKQEYRGIYAGVDGAFALSPNPANFAETLCAGTLTCTASGLALGPAGTVDVGYSWGSFGVEGVGMFRWTEEHVAGAGKATGFKAAPSLDTTFDQTAFGGGAGARYFTKHAVARFTGGMRVLLVHELFAEKVSSDSLFPGRVPATTNATTAQLAWDAGLLLGSTPGAKFHVGVTASLEFFGSPMEPIPVKPPVSGFTVEHGVQLFIGPTLGVQFGY